MSKKQKIQLTDLERRCLLVVGANTFRASDVGWALWGETTPHPNRGQGSAGQNKFCRPAGKILKRLEDLQFVRWYEHGNCLLWELTLKGSAQILKLSSVPNTETR